MDVFYLAKKYTHRLSWKGFLRFIKVFIASVSVMFLLFFCAKLSSTLNKETAEFIPLNQNQINLVGEVFDRVRKSVRQSDPDVLRVVLLRTQRSLRQEGLDPFYAYMLGVENIVRKGEPSASYFTRGSESKAVGVFQFTENTGRQSGLRIYSSKGLGDYYDERFDFDLGLEAFVVYLSGIEKRYRRHGTCSFGDIIRMSISSYHSGERNLDRALKVSDDCDVYKIRSPVGSYGRRSIEYVAKVDALRILFESYKYNRVVVLPKSYEVLQKNKYVLVRNCVAKEDAFLFDVLEKDFDISESLFKDINPAFLFTKKITKNKVYAIRYLKGHPWDWESLFFKSCLAFRKGGGFGSTGKR